MILKSDAGSFPEPEAILAKDPFRVLMVEDDRVHFTYCEYILQNIFGSRLDLEWARDCGAAVDRLNTGRFDICLLDYLVEGGSAKDVLSRVNLGVINTPIIVVSAFEDRSFLCEALRFGADDYVIKGNFTALQLEQAIQYSIYRKYKELMLRRRALYDPLTGLANRHLLVDRLEEVHRYSSRHEGKYAVLVLDLDRLKAVNDSKGHEIGDRYIVAAANALTACVRSSDTVSRVGGDEFVAILKSIRDKSCLARICQNLPAVLAATLGSEDLPVEPSCSIGVAVFPDDADSPETLMRLADEAMYAAKRKGGGGFRFA